MPAFEPEDFLAALRRLYDSQLNFDQGMRELKERQLKFDEELKEKKEQQVQTGKQLALVGACVRETAEIVRLTNQQMQHTDAPLDQLVGMVRSHEERLQRFESRQS